MPGYTTKHNYRPILYERTYKFQFNDNIHSIPRIKIEILFKKHGAKFEKNFNSNEDTLITSKVNGDGRDVNYSVVILLRVSGYAVDIYMRGITKIVHIKFML